MAGILVLASGAVALADTLFNLLKGRFFFNLGFVGIPIGYGLLIGRASSRKWALFFSRLAVVVACVIVTWAALDWLPRGGWVLGRASYGTWAEWLMLAGCVYVAAVLSRSGHQEWFAEEKQDTEWARSIAWGVTLAVMALCLLMNAGMAQMRESFAKARPLHVRITPYDAVSGKGLNNIGCRHEGLSSVGPAAGTRPGTRLSSVTHSSAEGMSLDFYGMVLEPYQISVGSAGYESQVVTLDGGSPSEIRVPLQPLEDAGAEKKPDAGGRPAGGKTDGA